MVTKPRLIAVSPFAEDIIARIECDYDAVLSQAQNMTVEEAIAAAHQHQAEALLISTRVRFSADHIAQLPASVKVIAACSVGYDHVDANAARARGIAVTNTPDVLTNATADLTLLLILGACRRAADYARIMRDGWRQSLGLADYLGTEVSGKTLGIYGMGRIGQAVAQRARGFDMKIIYHNRTELSASDARGAVYYPSLTAMLGECDIVSLHAPASPDGAAVMTAEMFAAMRKGSVFVNAARGKLVDEDALVNALSSGHLFGAGLDVFSSEPAYDLRFRDLPNVFMTPHMGSATIETRNAMGFRALDNIDAVCGGKTPQDCVN